MSMPMYIMRVLVGAVHVAVLPIVHISALVCTMKDDQAKNCFTAVLFDRLIRQFILTHLLGKSKEVYVKIPIQLFQEVEGKLRPLLHQHLILTWGRYGWGFANKEVLASYLASAAEKNQIAAAKLAEYVSSVKRPSPKKVKEMVPDWGFFFTEEQFNPTLVGKAIMEKIGEGDEALLNALIPETIEIDDELNKQLGPKVKTKVEGQVKRVDENTTQV